MCETVVCIADMGFGGFVPATGYVCVVSRRGAFCIALPSRLACETGPSYRVVGASGESRGVSPRSRFALDA